ncbi:MAG: GNAT family N-acetyltransferase [Colwellia sp.]|nr:GNAT family N-acetyltransferase [Colwellia sp.]
MNNHFPLKSVELEDDKVKLIPMALDHSQALTDAGDDLSIWQWTTFNYCKDLITTTAWINSCLASQKVNQQLPFVIIDKQNNDVVGSTSFLNISPDHLALEIGYTFIKPKAQRSFVNRRCKLLLLNYAFEQLNANRVALQTHEKNEKSRKAILGIGAKFEGVQRDCRIQENGTIRSSAFFSIIKPEWPTVKDNLTRKINSYG